MTSTAIVQHSDSAQNYLAAMAAGEMTDTSGTSGSPFPFPFMTVVQDANFETEDGTSIPFGHFHILGTKMSSNEITFRPLAQRYCIQKRAGKEDNYRIIGETVFFRDWKDERIDNLGTVDCGRRFGKDAEQLSAEDKEQERKKAELYLFVFGIATFPGEEPTPVLWKMRGSKSVRWKDATSKKALGCEYPLRNFTVKTVNPKKDPMLSKEAQAAVTGSYVNILVTPDMSATLPIEPVAEVGGMFMDVISQHNTRVREAHIQAVLKDTNSEPVYEDAIDIEYEEIKDLD